MKIYRGVVTSNADSTRSGRLKAKQVNAGSSDDNSILNIIYTSPYFNRNEGGVLAIPEVGSEILFVYDEEYQEYYYLSTIVNQSDSLGVHNSKINVPLINETILYNENDIPQAITFKDAKGAGLKVSNYYTPEQISARVELESAANHKLLLSDSPKMDGVILRNRSGDGIVITDQANDQHSARSIETKTKGAQRSIVRESEYLVVVADGRDLTLYNHSTGKFKDDNAPRQYGNINLNSNNKDVNLFTNGTSGCIYVTTHGGDSLVQINSLGEIKIYSKKNLSIKVDGDILMKSKNISMDAENINLKASQNIQIKATSKVKAEGTGGMDFGNGSSPLHLNKVGGAQATPPAVNIPSPTTHPYEDKPLLPQ